MSRIPSLGPRGEGWLALQLVAMLSVALAYGSSPAPDFALAPVSAIGWLGLIVGVVFVVAGSTRLRQAGSFDVLPKPRSDGELVESGVYALVRHPIYAGLIAGGLGLAALRASVPTLLVTIALAVILDLKRRREEEWLSRRYPAYADYRRQVKALVPLIY